VYSSPRKAKQYTEEASGIVRVKITRTKGSLIAKKMLQLYQPKKQGALEQIASPTEDPYEEWK